MNITCSGGATEVGCDDDEFGCGDSPILPGEPTDGIAFIESGIRCGFRWQEPGPLLGVVSPVNLCLKNK